MRFLSTGVGLRPGISRPGRGHFTLSCARLAGPEPSLDSRAARGQRLVAQSVHVNCLWTGGTGLFYRIMSLGVEAGPDPPQPTVGVLGPQCGPQPRSEPGRPSRPRRSIPLSGDRRFSLGERRWISATPRSVVGCSVGNPKWPPIWRFRQPPTPGHVQAIRSPSRPCEPGELNRGPHRDHLPSPPASG